MSVDANYACLVSRGNLDGAKKTPSKAGRRPADPVDGSLQGCSCVSCLDSSYTGILERPIDEIKASQPQIARQ